MTAGAIVMMTLAMVIIWGGTAISVTYLIRHPRRDDEGIQ